MLGIAHNFCRLLISFLHIYLYSLKHHKYNQMVFLYYIPINDTPFELSVFWLSDKESRINEVGFSDSI